MELFDILRWGPPLVGAVFLITGLLKAASPSAFLNHVRRLRLFPPQAQRYLVPAFVVLECALGAALIVGLVPGLLWPGAMAVLVVLAGLTVWSTSTGRVEDCGCYHGLVELTPAQSVLLDLAYAASLGAALWLRPEGYGLEVSSGTEALRWGATAAAAAFAGILYAIAFRRLMSGRDPLLDLSLLRVGRRWKPHWIPGAPPDLASGERLIVLLSTACPFCRQWVKPLNLIHRRADLPPVLGALVGPPEDVAQFAVAEGVHFPLVPCRASLVWHTIPGVPTAVHLIDGEIRGRWTGQIDPSLLERLRPGILERAKRAREESTVEAPEAPEPAVAGTVE